MNPRTSTAPDLHESASLLTSRPTHGSSLPSNTLHNCSKTRPSSWCHFAPFSTSQNWSWRLRYSLSVSWLFWSLIAVIKASDTYCLKAFWYLWCVSNRSCRCLPELRFLWRWPTELSSLMENGAAPCCEMQTSRTTSRIYVIAWLVSHFSSLGDCSRPGCYVNYFPYYWANYGVGRLYSSSRCSSELIFNNRLADLLCEA